MPFDSRLPEHERKSALGEVAELLAYMFSQETRLAPIPPDAEFLGLRGMSPEAASQAAKLHLLLAREVAEMLSALPRELRHLSHTIQTERVVDIGHPRSAVNWPATLHLRLTKGNDPTLYETRSSNRSFDTPENQLLRYCLEALLEGLSEVDMMEELDENTSIEPEWDLEAIREWRSRLETLQHSLRFSHSSVYLADVPLPINPSSRMITVAQTSRREFYRQQVVSVYNLIMEAERARHLGAPPKPLLIQMLEPLRAWKLFELLLLSRILREGLARAELVEFAPYLPTRRDHSAVARFRRGDVEISIFYQQLPASLRGIGIPDQLRDIVEYYGLPNGAQLPDIIVERISPEGRSVFLVEVKFTEDMGYIAESVAKLLGYLNHCRSCLRGVKIRGIICPYLDFAATSSRSTPEGLDILLSDAGSASRVLWNMALQGFEVNTSENWAS